MLKRKQKPLFPVKVIANTEIAPRIYTLETEKKFEFIPGQVVAVALSPKEEPRLYSIASGNQSNHIRLLFDINPEGLLTPRLSQLQKGDEILMSEPFGRFLGSEEPAWWIATGTGIAPFISMAESGLCKNKTLLHGARKLSDFWFADLFAENLNADYHRFSTRENGPGITEGRLSHWLNMQSDLPNNIKYYLCGNANMVIEVRDILVNKGVPFENVIAEIYF
ncbi:ferredoxin--NADP reductase [Marinilabilia rubra]|uniref:Oxidoreductase n=1 Tax=Marinilabilia rubra TaxID=2162893 RepID=A0A2U2B7E3_9BACT|nr:FAD-binding oxidoreductase [Marinilabilia rubra]PWD98975.1 oxidoreductase [Marinilabilia rubra]